MTGTLAADGRAPAAERAGEPDRFLDSGLLSPVRAGAPIESACDDAAWLQAMLDAEAALVRAQSRVGTVPERAARVIGRIARAGRFDLRELAVAARDAGNPVVALVSRLTAAVAEADPYAAEYVHRGSTSQDVMDTAAMLVATRCLRVVLADLDRVTAALAALAGTHRDTLMAGRTLGQHAVPTTFGLKAGGWLQAALDAGTRLRDVRDTLPAELGGAAGTLAGYLEYARLDTASDGAAPAVGDDYAHRLIAAYAAELGLAEPVLPWHTVRTPLAELASSLALVTGALGKFAMDVTVLTRTEIGELTEPTAAGRGVSSAMPQKRNPVLSTLVKSAARQLPALAASVTQCLLADDERPTGEWQAEWQPLREALRLTGGAAHAAAELAEGLTVHPDRMRANLGLTQGLVVTERLAAALTPRLGKARAKQLLTRVATAAASRHTDLADVLVDTPELRGLLTREEITGLLDPAHYTGAAAVLVDRVLTHYRRVAGPGGGA